MLAFPEVEGVVRGAGMKTLTELREHISREAPFVDRKPYSHNIISLTLLQISKQFGKEEANKCVIDFGLDKLGWNKEE